MVRIVCERKSKKSELYALQDTKVGASLRIFFDG